jgi:hypothetical protein
MTSANSALKKSPSFSRGGKRFFSFLVLSCCLLPHASFAQWASTVPTHIIAGYSASAAPATAASLGLNSFIGGNNSVGGLKILDDEGSTLMKDFQGGKTEDDVISEWETYLQSAKSNKAIVGLVLIDDWKITPGTGKTLSSADDLFGP